jgi:alkylation response protein AidB-like acyl-CoA dehydrogenase
VKVVSDVASLDVETELGPAVRSWLKATDIPEVPIDFDQRVAVLRDWQRCLYDAGWLGLGYPEKYGGSGGEAYGRLIVTRELINARAPLPVSVIGLELIAQVLMKFGSEEQRVRFLPPILRGDEIWCQGFSEPEHGSDLATLETKAVQTDDGFVIQGQKIWTTHAQFASWCAVLARTGEPGSRHHGISFLLVPMDSPGLEARPLRLISGDEEFGEVFFNEVFTASENIVGGLNGGWPVTMAMLALERGAYLVRRHAELEVAFDEIISECSPSLSRESLDLVRRIGEVRALLDAMSAKASEVGSLIARGGEEGVASSIAKLFISRTEQAVFDLAFVLAEHSKELSWANVDSFASSRWLREYLYSRASSVYGGTAQIQKSILAQRVLGLPRDGA